MLKKLSLVHKITDFCSSDLDAFDMFKKTAKYNKNKIYFIMIGYDEGWNIYEID